MRELFGNLRTYLSGKNYLVFSVIMLVLVGLPLTVVVLQRQQNLQQKATAATTFYLSPDSSSQNPLRTSVDGTVTFDIMINPGTNAISAVKLELLYDPTKFGEVTGTPVLTPNPATFPQVTEGPTLTPGRAIIGLSIGTDPTRAITAITKVGTLTLKVTSAISATSTISFGTNSSATSITTTGTTASANVLSSTTPAIVTTALPANATTIALTPVADTYVDSSATTTTHGTSTSIQTVGGTSPIKFGYLKFDLTSLAGKTIISAKLHATISNGSTGTQNFKNVSDTSWNETTMNYTTKPALGSVITTISNTTDNQVADIDLTSFVSEQKGKLASLGIDSTSTNTFAINSKEASTNKSILNVTYYTPTTTTAIPSAPISSTTAPSISPTNIPSVAVSQAPSPTLGLGGVCAAVATDTVLIIDKSGSMSSEITQAKAAAKLYIDQLAKNAQNRVSVVSFDSTATLLKGLTTDYAGAKSAIDTLTAGGGTCTQCGVDKANAEIATNGRNGIKKAVILMTDGIATKVNGKSATAKEAEAAAIASVKAGNTASGTIYFTIGLGSDVNATFLQLLATTTGATYSFSPTADQLAAIYQTISTIVGKGSVTGSVFVDLNNNGIKDATEPLAAGWVVTLKTSAGATLGTSTTNSEGTYSFTGLCDGTGYTATLTQKSGWTQTLPTSNGKYTISISNGSAVPNKDFGVSQGANPTERPLPIVTIHANPSTTVVGGSVSLTWTSEGADTCSASGLESGWTGQKATSGTQSVGPLTPADTYIFTLTCTNTAGDASSHATVTVVAPTPTATPIPTNVPSPTPTALPKPTVTLTASPNSLVVGGTTTLTWTSTNATSCAGSSTQAPDWTGTKAISGGSETVGPLTVPENYIFSLTCTNASGSSTVTTTVAATMPNATATPAPTSTPVPTVTLMPTPTTAPNATTLAFTVFLHSIGNSGDNVYPSAFSLSNKEPVHPQRPVTVSIYNAANQLETSATGIMTYASNSGNFNGEVTLPSTVTAGSHIVTITTGSFLTNLFPGIQTITLNTDNVVPATTLIAGDIDANNKLNILDYNTLLGCYTSEDQPTARSCETTQQKAADLNDEGIVNRYDYNLFLRELSVQSGFSL